MAHQALKLIPGVDQNKTPALNEAAISESQLIRFIPDRTQGGLVQKLGGWTKYYANNIGSKVRALWAWEDTNGNSYLGVGAEGVAAGGGGALVIIENGGSSDITPQTTTANIAVAFSTTAGSSIVTITHAASNIDNYDTVYIQTQVSVGGLVLFGVYKCYALGANTYNIYATDVLGAPAYATSTVATGGAVAQFSTTSGSNFVTVNLNDHGYAVDDTFPVLVATTVGGITFYGNYLVTEVTSANSFVISAANQASTTTTGYVNSGNVRLVYYNGVGPLPGGTGFGIGGYGRGGYGSGVAPTANTGTPINAEDWTLDNWGEILIACAFNGPLYEWNPTSGDPVALIIPNAPPSNHGAIVAMPQRQIIAWGSTFTGIDDPLLIRWCDVNNFNTWIASIENQAGSYRIPKGSRVIQCIQAAQQTYAWTDIGVWSMQYVGPPYVYQFNELGTGCGLIGRRAAASVSGSVYWMSQSQFFRMSGSGPEPIPCPIWDIIFQEIDLTYADKIRVCVNSRFGEISWHFPTNGSGGEPNAFVKYNFILNQWDYSFNNSNNPYVTRTAWINESVLGAPIGAGANNYIYQHETSPDADGQPMQSYFQTGYFVLNEADVKMFIDQVWPDMKWGYYGGQQSANVFLTFYVADYPGDTPSIYGPFTLTYATKFVTPRFRGRLVSIRIESNDINSWWRLGNFRYRIQQDGRY